MFDDAIGTLAREFNRTGTTMSNYSAADAETEEVDHGLDLGQATEEVEGDTDLGKDAFLKLLITQLKYQDPLDPLDDKEFVAQMAQFNSLEQMQNMNSNLERLIDSGRLAEASSLIGKQIEGLDSQGSNVSGTVESVAREGDEVYLVLEGEMEEGVKVSLDNLNRVFN